jgi:hypothetical protein
MNKSKEEAYALFDRACNQIAESNLIMAQKPLINLMKLISYNDTIRGCIADCYRSINYEETLKQVLVKDAAGHFHFSLPTSRRALVAVISKLLYEIMLGEQSLEKLISSVYYDLDLREAYVSFCEDILLPYKEAFKDVFFNKPSEEEEEPFEDTSVAVINNAVIAEVATVAGDIRSELLGDNRIDVNQRKQLISLIDGLCEVLESDLPKLVIPSWLGIQYGFGACKKCASNIARLKNVLEDYMLI